MFDSAFDDVGALPGDFLPEELLEEIEELNNLIYPTINNGVYRAGFATTQDAHNEAVAEIFDTLDQLEERLSHNRYLTGNTITEADWRLFTTLVRFDTVYVGHFICNLRRIIDYPNIWGYVRDIYQMLGIAETVSLDNIKTRYYASHETINPSRVIPKGPKIDFYMPHDREKRVSN
jgi:putative glutathione S-transferase